MRRAHCPRWLVLLAAVVVGVAAGAGDAAARDDKNTEARRLYEQATAAFGTGSYAEAAEKYEASFKLHPDAALLYNAAQAHRLAGNQPRALQLYRNFVRIYGDNPRANDARNHAAALEKALAEPGSGSSRQPPPAPMPPPDVSPPLTAPAATAPQVGGLTATAPATAPRLVDQPARPPGGASDEGSPALVRSPWFWVAVGAVVVGSTVAILFATRKDEYPIPTLGTLD